MTLEYLQNSPLPLAGEDEGEGEGIPVVYII